MNKLVVPISFFWKTVLATAVRCGAVRCGAVRCGVLETFRLSEYQIIVMGVQGFAHLPHILLVLSEIILGDHGADREGKRKSN